MAYCVGDSVDSDAYCYCLCQCNVRFDYYGVSNSGVCFCDSDGYYGISNSGVCVCDSDDSIRDGDVVTVTAVTAAAEGGGKGREVAAVMTMTRVCEAFVAKPLYCSGGNSSGSNSGSNSKNNSSKSSNGRLYDYGTYDKQPWPLPLHLSSWRQW